ncbi:uncharacterized protein E0L32_002720 [Thyridium curvatum]|uniref:RNI-like protein n=1 Tax=Thyridium curvatum TaxID=1093900 RepID=A0A507BM06_9PEZI|nr:uncharacterized protein E0L32_002720 [Thyridium curvatum]TPX18211.1 hypothetical protein E0L32_002720 [Thyridium curvatum]
MATATLVRNAPLALGIHNREPNGAFPLPEQTFNLHEAIYLAGLCRAALTTLGSTDATDFSKFWQGIICASSSLELIAYRLIDPLTPYTVEEILQLPLNTLRIDDELHSLPRRKTARAALAFGIASLLYPCHEGSLSSVIRYEEDRSKLRAWAALQRQYDTLVSTQRHGRTGNGIVGAGPGVGAPAWTARILAQGPWDPTKFDVSTDGAPALPMPVTVAEAETLSPFFDHLASGGTHDGAAAGGGNPDAGAPLDEGYGEPHYGVAGIEFTRGVVYEDQRMDLCKQVVGPDHIGRLMDSLRTNTFIKHFLLGNNIIGPVGAREIARFVDEFPDRMDTWYLAGNCIDGPSFSILTDSMVKSPAVTNMWFKRNPLGRGAAHDIFRLITRTNLRTLDLDQTELGDQGVAELFTLLAKHVPTNGGRIPLQHIYLNGLGISVAGASAIGSFLASPHCQLQSLYMSCNPLGDDGAEALAGAMGKATSPSLARLCLQSTGLNSRGMRALCAVLKTWAGFRLLDVSQAVATQDLRQAYNYIDGAAVPAILELVDAGQLNYLDLGHTAIKPSDLRTIASAVAQSPSLLFYSSFSILPEEDPKMKVAEAKKLRLEREQLQARLRARLESNVRKAYGDEQMTYMRFVDNERRWLVSDKTDVRKIDSVYRNRDAGLARRKLKTLVKEWDDDDDTLERVMKAHGPFCTLRQK